MSVLSLPVVFPRSPSPCRQLFCILRSARFLWDPQCEQVGAGVPPAQPSCPPPHTCGNSRSSPLGGAAPSPGAR